MLKQKIAKIESIFDQKAKNGQFWPKMKAKYKLRAK